MRKLAAAVSVSAAALLAACGSRGPVAPEFQPRPVDAAAFETIESWPAIGEVVTVQTGESMVRLDYFASMPALDLPSGASVAAPYNDRYQLGLTLAPGKYQLVGTDVHGGRYFVADSARYVVTSWLHKDGKSSEPGEQLRGGVYASPEGQYSVWYVWSGYSQPSMAKITSEVKPITVRRDPTNLRLNRHLIYTGAVGNALSISYREFSPEGMARPAFTQELRYELKPETTIGYQSARFQVLKADNTSITYKVVAPLQVR